jgi:diguanylate cyclase (GGDEF)-like protein
MTGPDSLTDRNLARPGSLGRSDTAVVLACRDGTVHYCNRFAQGHFGIGPSTGLGSPSLWTWFTEPDNEKVRRLAADQAAGTSHRLELAMRDGSGVLQCQMELYAHEFVLLAELVRRRHAGVGPGRLAKVSTGGRATAWLEHQRLALADALEAMQRRTAELEKENVRLQALARTDALTGLSNRHHFEQMLATEVDRMRRSRSIMCAVMVDLDRFKSVNDQFGHDVGDLALIGTARAMLAGRRPYDVVARFGGEEFVLLLPDTGLQAGLECAERLRRDIALESASSIAPLTASLGVAALAQREDGQSLIRRADVALYRAKRLGRDRVEYDQSVDEA